MEPNVDTNVGTGAPPQDTGRFDRDTGGDRSTDRGFDRGFDQGLERQERRSVRDELRAQFDEARISEPEEPEGQEPVRDDRQQYQQERARPGEAERRQQQQGQQQQGQQQGQQEGQQEGRQQVQAPAAWAKEARDVWAQIPPAAQQAIAKREYDVERGVQHLRNQYHQYYGELEQALTPWDKEISSYGKTRGQAVSQLFAWFDALAKNPDAAFPALLQSYGYDPRRLAARYGYKVNGKNFVPDQNAQQQLQRQQQIEQGRRNFQSYINNQVQQHIAPVYRHLQDQQTAQTHSALEMWAQDKPYFDHVRVTMGQLLTPDPQTGRAIVPLKDGKVDLDGAYEAACNMNPQIRQHAWEQYMTAQEAQRKELEAKKLKTQQEQVAKARRASNSLSSSAPGAPAARTQKGPPKGRSVKESLMDAIAEHSGR